MHKYSSISYPNVWCGKVDKQSLPTSSHLKTELKTDVSENPDFYAWCDFSMFAHHPVERDRQMHFAWGLAFSPSPCVLHCRSRFTNERWDLVTGESGVEDLVGNPMMLMKWVQSSLSALTYLGRVLVCCRLQQASRETLRWILILSGNGEKS